MHDSLLSSQKLRLKKRRRLHAVEQMMRTILCLLDTSLNLLKWIRDYRYDPHKQLKEFQEEKTNGRKRSITISKMLTQKCHCSSSKPNSLELLKFKICITSRSFQNASSLTKPSELCENCKIKSTNQKKLHDLYPSAIAQYQTTPLLLAVYPTPPHESRDPNQPIANFRCISVAPKEARFSGLPQTKITFSDKMFLQISFGIKGTLLTKTIQTNAKSNKNVSKSIITFNIFDHCFYELNADANLQTLVRKTNSSSWSCTPSICHKALILFLKYITIESTFPIEIRNIVDI
ncbi:hypothetical protein WN51_08668 [Melipona quadrifasciata]|uniref:Uncharacterized protein n=1 Tax=Melipona quadrifasciata TaxID=166423 RepID=A0A0M9AA11_9HYME|nr:hypothetical protein WN51_08668 [Melipona quadrifasciata]